VVEWLWWAPGVQARSYLSQKSVSVGEHEDLHVTLLWGIRHSHI